MKLGLLVFMRLWIFYGAVLIILGCGSQGDGDLRRLESAHDFIEKQLNAPGLNNFDRFVNGKILVKLKEIRSDGQQDFSALLIVRLKDEVGKNRRTEIHWTRKADVVELLIELPGNKNELIIIPKKIVDNNIRDAEKNYVFSFGLFDMTDSDVPELAKLSQLNDGMAQVTFRFTDGADIRVAVEVCTVTIEK